MPNNNTEALQQIPTLDLVERTDLVTELINKLRDNFFVAVSGPVGSGKSILVKDLLTQELLTNKRLEGRAGNDWRIVYTCPGVNPIGNLAADIRKASGNVAKDTSGKERGLFQEGTLGTDDQDLALEKFRNNSSILTQLYEKALSKIQTPFNLLLIVDQTHDLFRYQRFWSGVEGKKESLEPIAGDDILFINLLLNAQRSTAPIYVILVSDTRYTEYFSKYRGLPEAMNNSSFYVPNLTDAELDQFLDERLPPEAFENEQELKKLKDTLKQEFLIISEKQDGSALLKLNLFLHLFELKKQANPQYTLTQLAKDIGGHSKTLAPLQRVIAYFMEQYLGMNEPTKNVQYLFQALTGIAGENQPIRTPVTMELLEQLLDRKPPATKEKPLETLSKIEKILANLWDRPSAQSKATPIQQESIEKPLNRQQIYTELSKFNKGHEAFILLPKPSELSTSSIVDLNYDTLLSSWPRLETLIKQEWEYAQVYRNFVRDAILYYSEPLEENASPGKGFPVTAFTSIKKWMEVCRPNEAWAKRYLPELPKEMMQLKKHPAFAGKDEKQLTNLCIAKKFYTEIEDYFENQELQKENQKKRTEKQRTLAVILAIFCIGASIFGWKSSNDATRERRKIEAREFLSVLFQNEVLNIPTDIYKSIDEISIIQEEVDNDKSIKSDQDLLGYLYSQDKISIGSEREEVKKLSFEALITLKELYKVDDKEEKRKLLVKFEALDSIERNHNKAFQQTHYPAFYHALYAYYWEKKKYDTIPGTLIDPGALDVHADGKRYSFGDKNGQVHLVSTNTEYAIDRGPERKSLFTRRIKPIKSVSFGRKDTVYIGNELGNIYRYPELNTPENSAQKGPELIFTDDDKKTIHFLKSWPTNSNYLLVSNTFQVYFLNKKANGKFGHLTTGRADVVPLPDSRIACRAWDSESNLFLIGCRDSVLIYHLNPFAQKSIKKICSIKNDQTKTPVTFTSVAIKKKEDDGANSFLLALGDETGNVWIGDLLISNQGKEFTEYDLKEFRKFENVHASTITCMAFNPGSPQLASASYDGSLKFWNLNTLHKKNFDDVFLRYNSGIQAIAYLNKDELTVYYDLHHFVQPTSANFMYQFLKNNQD